MLPPSYSFISEAGTGTRSLRISTFIYKLKILYVNNLYACKVDPAETRTPDQSTFRKEYEPGSNKNRIGRKSSARRSDPARLHSSRHLGWAMVGDAKSRKCKKAILQRIRSGRRGAQPTSAHSSPQPAQATHHVAQAQRRRQRFDLKHRK